jgi:Tfp pilus assembly protein PilX
MKNSLHQSGFTLVVALLLLVALSFVGISGLRSVTLQEKMTGNMYFRALAFNEAQAGLRLGEQVTYKQFGTPSSTFGSCSASDPKNFCPVDNGASPGYLSKSTAWSTSNSVATALNSGLSSTWINESMNNEQRVRIKGCQETTSEPPPVPCDRMYMRTTVRSTDAATGALAIVQQHFRFNGNPDEVK